MSHPSIISGYQWQLRTTSKSGAYLFQNHDGVLLHNGAYSCDGISFSDFTDPPFAHWQNYTGYGGGTFLKTGAVGQRSMVHGQIPEMAVLFWRHGKRFRCCYRFRNLFSAIYRNRGCRFKSPGLTL